MEGKKISFGFKKVKKVEKPVVKEQKDFIECVEEKAIKVVGGEKVEEKQPLVIPLKPNTLITAEKLKEIAAKVESSLEEPMKVKKETEDIKLEPTENETLDQMAVRELLQEAKKEVKVETQALTVPVPAKPVMEGQKESTLEDYEAIPIQDFGMAMLRGMGWTPNQEKDKKYKEPQLRPKGLGLGADKVIKDKQKNKTTNKDKNEEELAIVKNSYVKIIAGKHSGFYGKVVSLDEDNGRVMVDITVKKETVSLSEFMMQPVTKAEFDKESKVINMDSYQEYKKKEQSGNQNSQNSTLVSKSRNDSPKVNDRNATSSKNSENNADRKDDRRRGDNNSVRENNQKSRRHSSSSDERSKKERNRRESRSEERVNRTKGSSKRYSSEEDRNRRNERNRREPSSSPERNRQNKNKSRKARDSSEEDEKGRRRRKEKSRRDSSEEDDRSRRRKKENSRRDSSEDDRRHKKKEKDKKRYSSNESLSSLSDTERKKKHKNSRKAKDSSDSESDVPKKDKRDIDKKRKGKKKKRDRDRSPHYKKHRK